MRLRSLLAVAAGCTLAASSVRAAATVSSPPPNVTRLAVHTPRPEYPPDAVDRGIAGHGVFLLRVDIQSGRVTQVIVGLSTGSRTLDAAAIRAFSQWRFRPGAVPYRKITSVHMSPAQGAGETLVKVPIDFAFPKA